MTAPTPTPAPAPTPTPAPGPAPPSAPPQPSPTAVSLTAVSPPGKSPIEGRIRLACLFALLALGLIVWSLLDPRPLPVIAAMSVGQAIGTLSLLFFVGSILLDLRARRILEKLTDKPSPPSKS